MSQDLSRIGPALEAALRGAQIDCGEGKAAGSVALARRYAGLLDRAVPAGRYRKPLALLAKVVESYRNTVRLTPVDERALDDMLHTITDALGEHSVASDLGPKLLAVLTALNLTLAGTGKGTDGNAGAAGIPGAGAMDELTARRATRTDRAKAVDATAT